MNVKVGAQVLADLCKEASDLDDILVSLRALRENPPENTEDYHDIAYDAMLLCQDLDSARTELHALIGRMVRWINQKTVPTGDGG